MSRTPEQAAAAARKALGPGAEPPPLGPPAETPGPLSAGAVWAWGPRAHLVLRDDATRRGQWADLASQLGAHLPLTRIG